MPILVPQLSGADPYSFGVAETYSYIPIANDQNRPIFAKASYITNFDDLQISLSSGNLDIGSVHISDENNGLSVSVADVGLTGLDSGKGALRVLSQDLDSNIDDITIGDKNNNFAAVNASLSALRVFVANPVSAVSVTNQLTGITVLNPVTAVGVFSLATYINQITGTQVSTNTLLNSVTANQATSANQTVTNTLLNTVTANQATQVTLANSLTSTTSNTNTLLNSVTANQATQITLEKTLSANSVFGTLSAQPLFVTVPTNAPLNVTYADGPQLDGNRRLRVALPSQTWWYVSSVDKDGDLRYNETFTTGASSIFVQNIACVAMTSGPSLTGSVIRATRRRFKIRPGVSHQWTGTVNWDGQDVGCVKRLGTFTNFNGMFFELSGADFNVVVRRRLTDGTLAEERVNRANFNNDKLDGNGLSQQNWSTVLSGAITAGTNRWSVPIPGDGIVYNTEYTYTNSALSAIKPGAKATISGVTPSGYNGCVGVAAINTATNKLTATYIFDPGTYSSVSNARIVNTPYHNAHTLFFEFNGGRTANVHFGINGTNGPTYLHTFDFANQLGLQYESAPALMVRNEVFNYSAMTYNPTMTIDGAAYTIEAESELNPGFIASYNTTPITLVAGKDQPILGIGLRAGEPYQRGDIQIQEMNIIDTANLSNQNNTTQSVIHWKLLLNPGLSGVPASTDIGKATRQWAYTSTAAVTAAGIELMSGFATSQAPIDTRTSLNFLNLGSNIEYTDADKVILTARLVTAGSSTSTIVGSMNAIEAL